MTDSIFSDRGFISSEMALDGLSRRQEVIGKNIANVDTPGYQAEDVNFEDSLRQALENNTSLPIEKTNSAHLSAVSSSSQAPGLQLVMRQGGVERADNNNVDINVELSQMGETGLRYETLSQLVTNKLSLLKSLAVSR